LHFSYGFAVHLRAKLHILLQGIKVTGLLTGHRIHRSAARQQQQSTAKQNQRLPNVPIIVLTNLEGTGDVEKALETAKAALKEHENNAEELQKATDDLTKASHKVAEILYKEKQGDQAAPQANTSASQDASGTEGDTGPNNQGPIETDFEQKQ